VVSAWAGDDSRTVQLLQPVRADKASSYVLEAWARSARNVGEWDVFTGLYDQLILRDPAAFEYRYGRMFALSDGGNSKDARDAVEDLRRLASDNTTNRAKIEFACGYAEERAGDQVRALGCYDLALELDPNFDEGCRWRILMALALGASVTSPWRKLGNIRICSRATRW
jgi:tetratricopeptide (TPR) repeat protein